MSAQYRLVYFVPDPFRGERVAVAALADGVGVVPRPGGLAGLGLLDAGARSLVHASLAELATVGPARDLPITIGPQIVGGPMHTVPAGVTNVASWLATTIFGRSTTEVATGGERVRRVLLGSRFLRTRGVDRLVRRRYQLPGRPLLGVVSQFVEGRQQTLLLEPIAMARPRAEEEVRAVAQLFAAYGSVLADDPSKQRVIYVLAGGPEDRRASVITELRDYAEVVDTTVPQEADALVARVKAVARGEMGMVAE
jgi:hypothetical protein